MGVCFYHARNFGKCFQVMRDVIEKFPVSPQVNEAYYYIGLGHFQLGHYSRAIQALEKVGTTLSRRSGAGRKARSRQAALREDRRRRSGRARSRTRPSRSIASTTSGDEETVECFPVGRNVRLVLGSRLHAARQAAPEQRHAGSQAAATRSRSRYTDEHTADKKFESARAEGSDGRRQRDGRDHRRCVLPKRSTASCSARRSTCGSTMPTATLPTAPTRSRPSSKSIARRPTKNSKPKRSPGPRTQPAAPAAPPPTSRRRTIRTLKPVDEILLEAAGDRALEADRPRGSHAHGSQAATDRHGPAAKLAGEQASRQPDGAARRDARRPTGRRHDPLAACSGDRAAGEGRNARRRR